jgi:predicted component of type VI protein secretion system
MATSALRALAFALLVAGSALTHAQNPNDVRRAQERASAIHATSLQQIAQATGLALPYIASFLGTGANAGKKLSEEADLTAKQYRTVRRLIAQRNYAVRETYADLGVPVPTGANISFL